MVVIGITGGFATGKTTVANFFSRLGARVIDADRIAHDIIRRNSPAFKEIILAFGRDILSRNKSIVRKRLAAKVFGNKKALRKLCRITHPLIIDIIKKKLRAIEKTNPQSIVVIDAPLLVETGLNKIVNWLLVVDTTPARTIQRCMAKRGFSECEIKRRNKAQLSIESKKKIADCLIDNNGTPFKTKKLV